MPDDHPNDVPKEPEVLGRGSRMFQIYEDDLAELEHTLPELMEASFHLFAGESKNRFHRQWSRVRDIISNVRWNYGPPDSVEIIPT